MASCRGALTKQLKRILQIFWTTHSLLLAMMLALIAPSQYATAARADNKVTVLPDSSNFVTASLLTMSPTKGIYSTFGHVAFRMECPVHGLDFVFTYESDPGANGLLTFFAGKADSYYVAVPTQQFLKDMKKEGRGIWQYELNLTLHEEQNLWRNLDNDMLQGAHRKFNLQNHCVSTMITLIQQSCIDEYLEFGPQQGEMLLNNGDLLRHYVGKSKWAEFAFISFIGTHYEEYDSQDVRVSPQNIASELARASFVSTIDGSHRPVLTGKTEELLHGYNTDKGWGITPIVLFAILLLLTCLITFGERRWHWKQIARWYDKALLVAQTLAGIVLLAILFGSNVFGHCWNWYLIPFNPLPLLIWTCFHKQKNFGRIYIIYTVVLAAFIALTPFISQLDVPHQLLVVTLAVRCLSKYLEYKKNIK